MIEATTADEWGDALQLMLDTWNDRVARAVASGCTRQEAEAAVADWLTSQLPPLKETK